LTNGLFVFIKTQVDFRNENWPRLSICVGYKREL